MKLSELVHEVIRLADAIRNYWANELPKRHPNYPVITLEEDSGPPPPEEKKLRNLLKKLPDDQIYQLILLMYLGRGDFDTSDLGSDYEALKETFGKREWAVAQMMDKAPLADYLSDGLEALKKGGIDVDHLQQILGQPAKSPT